MAAKRPVYLGHRQRQRWRQEQHSGATFRQRGAEYYNPSAKLVIKQGLAPDIPKPNLLLHMNGHRIINLDDLKNTPDWAKPIVAVALKLHKAR